MGDEVELTRVTADRYQDVIHHLRTTFFADEPLNRALSLCDNEESISELEDYSLNVLKRDLSVMAIMGPQREVVGACLLGDAVKSNKNPSENSKVSIILKFIGEVLASCDFGDVPEREIMGFKILSVDGRLRGRGIATQLYLACEKISREQGCKLLRAEATALFSQKILANQGWQVIKEVKYKEYPSADKPLFIVEPPHDSLQVMIKRL